MSNFKNIRKKAKDAILSEESHGIFDVDENEDILPYLIKSMINRYFEHNVGGSSAKLTYYLIFSFSPFLLFLNAALAYAELPTEDILYSLAKVIPSDAVDIISSYLNHIYTLRSKSFLILGLGIGIYSTARAINSLLSALSLAYRAPKKGGIRHTIIAVIFTVMIFIAFVFLLIAITLSKNILARIWSLFGFSYYLLDLWNMLRWFFVWVLTFFIILGIYRIVPYRRIRFLQALPGVIFAAVVWFISSWIFSFYVENFARYSVVYGSLGAIIVLLLWLYLTGIIIIMGGELNDALIYYKERHFN